MLNLVRKIILKVTGIQIAKLLLDSELKKLISILLFFHIEYVMHYVVAQVVNCLSSFFE